MSRDRFQGALFREGNRRRGPVKEARNTLQSFCASEIDLVKQNPVGLFSGSYILLVQVELPMTQPQRFDQRTLHECKGELAVALHVLNIEALHIALKV